MSEDHPFTAIKVALAKIEQRQEDMIETAKERAFLVDGRFIGITHAMEKLASKDDLIPLRERVDKIETTQNWIVRSALAGFSLVGGGLYAVGKKLGLA